LTDSQKNFIDSYKTFHKCKTPSAYVWTCRDDQLFFLSLARHRLVERPGDRGERGLARVVLDRVKRHLAELDVLRARAGVVPPVEDRLDALAIVWSIDEFKLLKWARGRQHTLDRNCLVAADVSADERAGDGDGERSVGGGAAAVGGADESDGG
jgi:hypothetical protein